MPNKPPNKVTLTTEQVKALQERLTNKALDDQDVETLLGLLSFNLWMQDQLSRAKLTINRLRGFFGFTSESRKNKNMCSDDNAQNQPGDDVKPTLPDEPITDSFTTDTHAKPTCWDQEQNHGRYGASDYTGCQHKYVPFQNEQLRHGKCADCHEHATDAKLYSVAPRVVVLLDSAPLVTGVRYELQKARCSVCQKYFTAEPPDDIAQQSKYSYRCSTSIAIYHYYAGVPFKRLEMLQAAQGIPLPDATQYDLMQTLYESAIAPIAEALRSCAANGNSLYFDDTPGRILEQTLSNQQANTPKSKKAVHATALLAEYESHRIYLFDTNTQTAGKQLNALLSKRKVDDKFITMSDASANNFTGLDDKLMARWIISLCLAHGRRRFVELLSGQDKDMEFILDLIAKVYANERYCKETKLNSDQRLLYHQRHSGPTMAAMFTWFNNLILYKEVEPNSRFGEAIRYMLKNWEWLTQFLHVPGASLDNNICEQAIKVMIRYRNNSLFYRTFYGASIGDAMMSVLHTALAAGANIFDYLNTLQENVDLVQSNPGQWLPWNYQETLMSRVKDIPLDTS